LQKLEVRLEGVVLEESSVMPSPMLPYVRMLLSSIERVAFTQQELVSWLRQAMRQHSIARQSRTDYVLRFLNRHPP
jgi:hypothetical protein